MPKSTQELLDLRAQHVAELRQIADTDTEARSENASARFIEVEELISNIDTEIALRNRAAKAAEAPNVVVYDSAPDHDPIGEPGSIRDNKKLWDLDAIAAAGPSEARNRAFEAIEKTPGLTDRQRKTATAKVESLEDDAASAKIARHILAVSAPEYMRAFSRALRNVVKGGQPDSADLQVLQRAASLTDAAGGYAIPLPIDPTITLNDDGTTNPFRGVSRVVTGVTDVLRFVDSTAVSASWDGEAAEVSDDMTTLTNTDITAYKAQALIPYSIEIGQDWPNLTQYFGSLIATEKDDLEAAAFATGSGTNRPVGIVTALTGGSYEVASNSSDTFAISDVYDLEEELPAKFRKRAVWAANKRIYQAVREGGGANLDDFWANLGGGQPPLLLGYPALEASEMDGTINAGAENYVLILGDFSNYVIYDRAGLSIELVPHLLHTSNNRPSGQRGLYAWWRVGGDSILDRAFRMLNVT